MAARNSRSARARGAPTFSFENMIEELGDKDSRRQRVAYYLDWAARNLAYQYQPYNVIAHMTSGTRSSRLPRMDSDEVVGIRRTLHSIRKALREKYGRSLDVAAGGVRATVDSDDHAAVVMPKKIRRFRGVKDSLLEEYKLINPAQIRDAKVRSYINRPVRELMRIIGSDDFDKKLLPPSGGGEEGGQ